MSKFQYIFIITLAIYFNLHTAQPVKKEPVKLAFLSFKTCADIVPNFTDEQKTYADKNNIVGWVRFVQSKVSKSIIGESYALKATLESFKSYILSKYNHLFQY